MANEEFYGFKPPSESEWFERITKDLKGKSFDDFLKVELEKGIILNAVHYPEAANVQNHIGSFPYTRGVKTQNNAYRIEQSFDLTNPNEANENILEALKNGISSIALESVSSKDAVKLALRNVHADFVCIGLNSKERIESAKIISEFNLPSVFYGLDPFTNDSYSVLDAILFAKSNLKQGAYCFSLDGPSVSDQGGGAVSELYYLVKAGNEILYQLTEQGITIDDACATLSFNLAFNSSYYLSVAKTRALRLLWSNVVKQYHPKYDCSMNCWIHGVTNKWNKLNIDKDTNILRATTEAMSAVLSGVDSLEINHKNIGERIPQDQYRIARNLHHLINEESYLSQVADPLGGSYMIEDLTKQLAEVTWELFKQDNADFEHWTEIPGLKERVRKEQDELQSSLENEESVLIGGNKFRSDSNSLNIDQDLNLNKA